MLFIKRFILSLLFRLRHAKIAPRKTPWRKQDYAMCFSIDAILVPNGIAPDPLELSALSPTSKLQPKSMNATRGGRAVSVAGSAILKAMGAVRRNFRGFNPQRRNYPAGGMSSNATFSIHPPAS